MAATFATAIAAVPGVARAQATCIGPKNNCQYDTELRRVVCDCQTPSDTTTREVWGAGYQLVSIIYAPPGKDSEVKYGAGSSFGSKTELSSSSEGGAVVHIDGTGADFESKFTLGTKSGSVVGWQKAESVSLGLSGNGVDDAPAHLKDVFTIWTDANLVIDRADKTKKVVTQSLQPGAAGIHTMDFTAEELLDRTKIRTEAKRAVWDQMTAADRAAVLAVDPFLTKAGLDPKRFRKVETLQLLGPDNPGDLIPSHGLQVEYDTSKDSYLDQTTKSETTLLFGGDVNFFGILEAGVHIGGTFSYTYESVITSSVGAQQAAEVTLKTSTPGYRANVDVYMDAAFGTFASVVTDVHSVQDAPSYAGHVVDAQGNPMANQVVTVYLSNTETRRVLTNAAGIYRLDAPIPIGYRGVAGFARLLDPATPAGARVVVPAVSKNPSGTDGPPIVVLPPAKE